ncbi:MAG TPA: zf-HC2 domain-containing protein [Candidatus Limnocylindrales bacterium]|nr:zf-HC2 domain-containing protein [Candidatus Limnocylindrales bacterium]
MNAAMVLMRPWVATCDETRERLSAHLEGDLEGREAKRVLRHLVRCPYCREALRSLARTVEGLRSLGRGDALPRAGPSVADAVVDRIRRGGT